MAAVAAGVFEAEADLLGRGIAAAGDIDRPEGEEAEIGEEPAVAVLGDQSHPGPVGHAQRGESRSHRTRLFEQPLVGQLFVAGAASSDEGRAGAFLTGAFLEAAEDAAAVISAAQRRTPSEVEDRRSASLAAPSLPPSR